MLSRWSSPLRLLVLCIPFFFPALANNTEPLFVRVINTESNLSIANQVGTLNRFSVQNSTQFIALTNEKNDKTETVGTMWPVILSYAFCISLMLIAIWLVKRTFNKKLKQEIAKIQSDISNREHYLATPTVVRMKAKNNHVSVSVNEFERQEHRSNSTDIRFSDEDSLLTKPISAPVDNPPLASSFLLARKSQIISALNMSKKASLLIVDTDSMLCHGLAQVLGDFFHCSLATSEAQVIEYSLKNKQNLIISGLTIAENSNGLGLIEMLKNNIETAHLPIIVYGDNNDCSVKICAIQAQADAWIDRSSPIELLLAQIITLLNQQRRIEQNVKNRLDNNADIDDVEQATSNPHAAYFCKVLKELVTKNYQDGQANLDVMMSQHLNESVRNVQYKAKKFLPNGLSLKLCINGYRGLQAMQLLTTTDLPIKAIYLDAGFANERQMSRWFDRYLSLRPTEYRAGLRSENGDVGLNQIADFFKINVLMTPLRSVN